MLGIRINKHKCYLSRTSDEVDQYPSLSELEKIQRIINDPTIQCLNYEISIQGDLVGLYYILQNKQLTKLVLISENEENLITDHAKLVDLINTNSIENLNINDLDLNDNYDFVCQLIATNCKIKTLYCGNYHNSLIAALSQNQTLTCLKFSILECYPIIGWCPISTTNDFIQVISQSQIRRLVIYYYSCTGYSFSKIHHTILSLLQIRLISLQINYPRFIRTNKSKEIMNALASNYTLTSFFIGRFSDQKSHIAPECADICDSILDRNRTGWTPNNHYIFTAGKQQKFCEAYLLLRDNFPNELSFLILNLIS